MDVHRYWKVLTLYLPPQKWYTDTRSPWTLDYPPGFACLEWLLAHMVALVDKHLFQLDQSVTQLDIWIMRSTVVLCDLCLAHAVYLHLNIFRKYQPEISDTRLSFVFAVFVLQPSLFFVDHIHFQYNGFLIACLFYSSYFFRLGKYLSFLCSVAILVLLKQTFLYIVPVSIFACTCQRYVARYQTKGMITFCRLFIQSSIVFAFFVLLGISPWIVYKGQWRILCGRLFPFHRGLLHAYWAPHFWALYGCLDLFSRKCIQLVFPHSQMAAKMRNITSSATRGWIGIRKPFVVLPNPSPWMCHVLVVVGMLFCFYRLWKKRHLLLHPIDSMWLWVRAWSGVWLSSFLFGWHVHEKAILMPQFCMLWYCLIKEENEKHQGFLLLLLWLTSMISTVASSCMVPLIFGCLERIVVLGWILWMMMYLLVVEMTWRIQSRWRQRYLMLHQLVLLLLLGLPGIVHRWLPRFPFLPQMLLSGYGGIICGWVYVEMVFGGWVE
jgi:alpha-1,3-glucosyltransferase